MIKQQVEWRMDPRENSNIGTMLCFHGRYSLGDNIQPSLSTDMFSGWEEMEEYLRKEYDIVAMKPLYLYDHSGITISTMAFASRWDSWQIGFIFAIRENVLNFYSNRKRITSKRAKIVRKRLVDEVEAYDYYIRGGA